MKSVNVFILLLLCPFFIFAQSISVPQKVKESFKNLYPKINEVSWSKEGKNEYEASFKNSGVNTSIVLDAKGTLQETETAITASQLPKGTEEYVAKNYKGYKITETAKIVDAKGIVTFETQISKDKKNKDLIFTNDGKPVVKKETIEEKEEKGQKADDEENEN